ncbi:hypothetical protein A0H81_04707 [Grifola frondosa]|uniref:Uncharacterized protein n=1 Tax=Grifola frondosa TaxID=5627 RepID=A0A1C7MFA1_GRIFR|nr:hypothetical protein A0H81_04707 [Grifola frondosa]
MHASLQFFPVCALGLRSLVEHPQTHASCCVTPVLGSSCKAVTHSSSSFHRLRALVRLPRASMMILSRTSEQHVDQPIVFSADASRRVRSGTRTSQLARKVIPSHDIDPLGEAVPRPQLTVLDVPQTFSCVSGTYASAHEPLGCALDCLLDHALGHHAGTHPAPRHLSHTIHDALFVVVGVLAGLHGALSLECCVFSFSRRSL